MNSNNTGQYLPNTIANLPASTLASLAREVDRDDNVDWRSMSDIDLDKAYMAMAEQVKEMFSKSESVNTEITLAATVVKLLVDNFLLYQLVKNG